MRSRSDTIYECTYTRRASDLDTRRIYAQLDSRRSILISPNVYTLTIIINNIFIHRKCIVFQNFQ